MKCKITLPGTASSPTCAGENFQLREAETAALAKAVCRFVPASGSAELTLPCSSTLTRISTPKGSTKVRRSAAETTGMTCRSGLGGATCSGFCKRRTKGNRPSRLTARLTREGGTGSVVMATANLLDGAGRTVGGGGGCTGSAGGTSVFAKGDGLFSRIRSEEATSAIAADGGAYRT